MIRTDVLFAFKALFVTAQRDLVLVSMVWVVD